ncbi:LysE family translocator [Thalassotalea euphylliae]|uniref:LysE family translocator n=1 Tax=Thalassotalea euphylliae TaxID=1655234 RepID=A0A3E0U3K5_9GAMM|nr:LysE family translocator [Thalassotalea euphylliae]REL31310.1 LysE family translocator [Thalassotalea euphylliae]
MLETTQVLAYVTALGVAAAIPGPGMTALVARSISGGATVGFTMLTGLILGDLIYLSLAVFGLALLVQSSSSLFGFISIASATYLGWLAWQFWFYKPKVESLSEQKTSRELFSAGLSGLAITLGNPKTIAFYLAILPLVVTLETVSLEVWGTTLIPLTVAVLVAVGAIFILGALKVRHILDSEKSQSIMFKGTGVIMLLTSLSMLAKQFQ